MTYEVRPEQPPHGGPPAGRRRRRVLSLWLPALAVAFLQLAGSHVAGRNQTGRVGLDGLGYALLAAGPALLLLRRRRPVEVAAAVAVVTLLYLGLGYPYGPVFVSLVVAFFSAVAAGHRKGVLVIAGCAFAVHALVGLWLYRWLPPSDDGGTSWAELSGAAAWLLAVLAAAELFRLRRERFARERAERAEEERRRTDAERMRIAQELHDVLAHSISLINVQAGVALALMDEHPEQARTALTTIKAASKEALGEVRQVLSTLRAPGAAPRAPAPGLDRLPELLEQASAAGLRADLTVEGERTPLPPGADLAAFRIVQEALTNVVRHSGSRAARLLLAYRPGSVHVQVDDDGPAAPGGETGGGNGLLGMRERAAALGGSVQAGPRPDGGFRVTAHLPLDAPDPPPPPSGRSGSPPSGAHRDDRPDPTGPVSPDGPDSPGARRTAATEERPWSA
jgi:signal transduction histidine kinase